MASALSLPERRDQRLVSGITRLQYFALQSGPSFSGDKSVVLHQHAALALLVTASHRARGFLCKVGGVLRPHAFPAHSELTGG